MEAIVFILTHHTAKSSQMHGEKLPLRVSQMQRNT